MTDIVDIIVRVVDQYSRQLNEFDAKLQKASRGRNAPVRVTDNGTISRMDARLKRLTRPETKQIFVQSRMDDFDKLRELGGPQTQLGDFFGGMDQDRGLRIRKARLGDINRVMNRQVRLLRQADRAGNAPVGRNSILGMLSPTGLRRFLNRSGLLARLEKTRGLLSRMIPSWHTWVSIIAVLLPMVIALAVALGGVATAMVAVAGAGVAMAGLGLLGEGDSMAVAFERAKRRLSEFKQELFDVAQPLAKVFAPFSQRMFMLAPGMLTPLARSLESLTVFEDSFERAFAGVIAWVGRAVEATASFKQEIDTILETFGPVIGDAIINFFAFLISETVENREAFIRLGGTLKDVMLLIFQLSLLLSKIVLVFQPLIDAALWLADLLDNRLTAALAASIVAMVMMDLVMQRLIFSAIFASTQFLRLWGTLGRAFTVIKGITSVSAAVHALNAALTNTAVLSALATGGLTLLAGAAAFWYADKQMSEMQRGLESSLGGRPTGAAHRGAGTPYGYSPAAERGSTVNYNINIERMDRDQRNSFEDDIEAWNTKNQARGSPDPEPSN